MTRVTWSPYFDASPVGSQPATTTYDTCVRRPPHVRNSRMSRRDSFGRAAAIIGSVPFWSAVFLLLLSFNGKKWGGCVSLRALRGYYRSVRSCVTYVMIKKNWARKKTTRLLHRSDLFNLGPLRPLQWGNREPSDNSSYSRTMMLLCLWSGSDAISCSPAYRFATEETNTQCWEDKHSFGGLRHTAYAFVRHKVWASPLWDGSASFEHKLQIFSGASTAENAAAAHWYFFHLFLCQVASREKVVFVYIPFAWRRLFPQFAGCKDLRYQFPGLEIERERERENEGYEEWLRQQTANLWILAALYLLLGSSLYYTPGLPMN